MFRMMWRAMGLAEMARRVTGCYLTQGTRVKNALDDVASNIYVALPPSGGASRRRGVIQQLQPRRRRRL